MSTGNLHLAAPPNLLALARQPLVLTTAARFGADLIKTAIRKDKPGRGSTYTLRYFIREHYINGLTLLA